ncbi:MAG TPA: nuclear transport factor 2 family protein [Acidimicrobiales bacterium]|nr:nuclear transport factor 2 family protein [Acidimicrobiales bacterium]
MSVADELFAAIEAGDVDRVREIYAPDAVIWHNNDELEQTVDQNLRVLRWVCDNLADRAYEDVRRHEWDGGFVQQHVLRFTRDGRRLGVPACIVATVDDGKITRIDEYLDSAHVARITGG